MLSKFASARLQIALAALGLLVVVIAQWILFGFNIPGQSDEWIHLARIEYVPFTVELTLRPLIRLPWAIAYWLTPGSFLGLNLVLAAALFVKGLALYGVLRRLLPEYPALAYAAGILFVVYPADDAAFALYTVGIHVSAACYLVAVYGWLIYWQRPGIWPAIGIWLMLLIALGIVEIAYPMVFITPLILRLQHAAFIPARHKYHLIGMMVVWYIVPILLMGRAAILMLQGIDPLGYQSASVATDNSIPALIDSLLNAYRWQLWEMWPQALVLIGPVRLTSLHTWVTLICALLTGGVIGWHTRNAHPGLSMRSIVRLLVMGIAGLGLGFLAFLPSAFRDSIERTTLFSSIGAVLVIIALMLTLTRSPRPLRYGVGIVLLIVALNFLVASQFASRLVPLLVSTIAIGLFVPERWRYTLVIAGLVGIGTAYTLNRHEKHIARALRQEPILTALTQVVPQASPETVLLLFDAADSTELYHAFWWRNDVLNGAVGYLYADYSLEAYVCLQDSALLNVWMGECKLEQDHFALTYPINYQATVIHAYARVVALRYSPEAGFEVLDADELQTDSPITGYDPSARIDSASRPPPRLRLIYDHPPLDWQAMFKG